MTPDEIVDRAEACKILRISRQTLAAWVRKGKLKVLKRVGHGSNAALLFDRTEVEGLLPQTSGGGIAGGVRPNADKGSDPMWVHNQ